MIGFHLDDTEWNDKENCLREESLYNTNDKTFEHPNHDKVLVYCGKTGWSMEDKQEEDKCTK
jgi:hypothetical protein